MPVKVARLASTDLLAPLTRARTLLGANGAVQPLDGITLPPGWRETTIRMPGELYEQIQDFALEIQRSEGFHVSQSEIVRTALGLGMAFNQAKKLRAAVIRNHSAE